MTKEITVKTDKEGVTQQELQEKLLLFQLMEKQLEALREQEAMVEARTAEIEGTRKSLEEIGKAMPDNETLIPLGSGLYANARVTDKQILTELGAGVMVRKGVKDAMSFLDERSSELEKVARQIVGQEKEIVEKLNEMGPALQRMIARAQKQ